MAARDEVTLLRGEHRGIIRQLGLVGRSLDVPGQREKLRESISELGSRLKSHFAHEEKALYARLDSRLKEGSPTEELLADHEMIQGEFMVLDRMGAGGATAPELRKRFSSLRSALKEHLEKEERVVFWLADSHP